jgi:hypothetical protein
VAVCFYCFVLVMFFDMTSNFLLDDRCHVGSALHDMMFFPIVLIPVCTGNRGMADDINLVSDHNSMLNCSVCKARSISQTPRIAFTISTRS